MTVTKHVPTFRGVGFGDPHVQAAARCPGCRDPGAWGTELELHLDQVYAFAEQLRADFLFCPGDWFHSKAATTHADVLRAIRACRKLVARFGPILTTTGNHDMVGHNLQDSQQRQPIQILAEAGIIRRVDLEAAVFEKDGHRFAVIGSPYPFLPEKTVATNLLKTAGPIAAGILWLTHAELYRDDDRKIGDHLRGLAAAVKAAVMLGALPVAVVNGHVHDDAGAVRVPTAPRERCVFVNTGCLGRVSYAERDLTPQMALVTFGPKGVAAKLVSLEGPGPESFTSASEDPEVSKADAALMDEFAAKLAEDDGDSGTDLVPLLRSFAAGRRDATGACEAAVRIIESVTARR